MRSTRIGTNSNLPVGGTDDLLLIDFVDSFPEGQIKFDIKETPRKITGVQKVAQLFLKILLTKRGTDILRPHEGTDFAEYTINANRTGFDTELYSTVISQVKSASDQVKYVLNSKSNPDLASQLFSVDVLGVNIQTESLTMFVKITTMAGETAEVSIPFPQLDLKISGET